MSGYTENNIIIIGEPEKIFDLTNNIERWPELFTEYKEAKILEKNKSEILFKLTTKDGKNWMSKRSIDSTKMEANAKRIEPMFPFKKMDIKWKYEKLPQDLGIIMTWIQDFEVDPLCKHDTYDMESYLNRTSRIQMKEVKLNVERILNEQSLL